jgi:CheY-like chemotaxis protein
VGGWCAASPALANDRPAFHVEEASFADIRSAILHHQVTATGGRQSTVGQIKADERTRHVLVIALSADPSPHEIQRRLDAGATDDVTQPLAKNASVVGGRERSR